MSESILSGLNPSQRHAVSRDDGPALILAGAGSGKTRVITRRIAWLLSERHVPPESIVAMTFTNRAAREMHERVVELVGDVGERVHVSTFHSAAARWLRRLARHVGLQPNFSIYDTRDQLDLLQDAAQAASLPYDRAACRKHQRKIESFTNRALSLHDVETESRTPEDERFADLFSNYQQALQQANAVDFGHLITHVVHALESSDELRSSFRHRYRHIFVDEFQDTNVAQYRLLRALAGSSGNVTAVGDDDQSIYGWRGASVANMRQFLDEYEDVELIKLEQNYRSSGPILGIANAVVAPLEDRLPKTLRTDREEGVKPTLAVLPDDREEARFVARSIRDRLAQGELEARNVAIFYRTNAQSLAFEEALRLEAVPHEIVGNVGFFDRREVRDLVAWLRVVANPADDVSFSRIINTPPRGIGTATIRDFVAVRGVCEDNLTALREMNGTLPARINSRTADGLRELETLLFELREMRDDGPGALIRFVLERTGYLEWLKRREPETADDRERNVAELLSFARSYERQAAENDDGDAKGADDGRPAVPEVTNALQAFLEHTSLETTTSRTGGGGAVQLMTIHTAKGLEFPVVYVTGLEEDTLPLSRRDGDRTEAELSEERRLCYVAFTRAEDELWLTAALRRQVYGRSRMTEGSRFLREIPGEEIAIAECSSVKATWWAATAGRADAGRSWRKSQRSPDMWGSFDQSGDFSGFSDDVPTDTQGMEVPDDGVLFDERFYPEDRASETAEYVGKHARHKLFGVGEVVGADASGSRVQLTIDFGDEGVRKVIKKYVELLD